MFTCVRLREHRRFVSAVRTRRQSETLRLQDLLESCSSRRCKYEITRVSKKTIGPVK